MGLAPRSSAVRALLCKWHNRLIVRSLKPFLVFVALALIAFAAAKPPFWKVFMATYNIDPNSKIGKNRCLNCHMPPGPPKRNPYGLAVGEALHAANSRMVTADILAGVAMKNDGDGVPFIDKIKKDIPPATIMPKAAPKPKPTPKTTKPKKKVVHKTKAKKRSRSVHGTTKG